ncbi:ROK family protein [Bifidobacterium sp. MA2]|uniref:ROK family protein n=1 Tax=Bifidobacterium santillanense TaxID=2809028 RepID=A0ABS5UMV0_9BIFI|nr:ROK family protein [Bifidobacterium santillanense]MBT1172241.1 ROK family protein [Bifidobacterium santillanense]
MTAEPTHATAHAEQRRWLVGVDVGGTKIEAALVDPDSEVRSTARVPARRGEDNLVEDVVAVVREVAGSRLADVAAVGIGTPGRVENDAGIVEHIVNLDVEAVALGPRVSGAIGVPVHVENDVNAAALGAARLLPEARGDGVVTFLNFGTGLAAGVIVDGELCRGASGALGEVGHIPVDPNRFDCPCGQRGCLETVCSGAAVAKLWPVAGGEAAMPDLIIRAAQGEVEACRVLGMVKHAIGDVIQIVVQALDPDVIIIGGGMSRTGEPLMRVIEDELSAREEPCPFLRGLHLADRLRLAPADAPLGALGAALSAGPAALSV